MNERKELIERLSEYASTSLAPALMRQAADMLEADAQRLSNLLARIHRDGGHYEVEHGTDKAVADADLKVAQAYADLFELQQTATSDEWLANCPQSVRDLANKIKAEMAVPQEPVALLQRRALKPQGCTGRYVCLSAKHGSQMTRLVPIQRLNHSGQG